MKDYERSIMMHWTMLLVESKSIVAILFFIRTQERIAGNTEAASY